MELFQNPCFLHILLDDVVDADMMVLLKTSRSTYREIESACHTRLQQCTGTLSLSKQGIAGLSYFYPFNQLPASLQKLSLASARMQYGKIVMCKEIGFAASLQVMECTCFPLGASGPSYCKMYSDKCVCKFFMPSPWDYSHLSNCKRSGCLEGLGLSLETLSGLMKRLQGEIVIPNQKRLDMWHAIFDTIDLCPVVVNGGDDAGCYRYHAGPALYHHFEFDTDEIREMLEHPEDAEGNYNFCRSSPATVHHERYGECTIMIDLEVQEGFLFVVTLNSLDTGEDVKLVGRYSPGGEVEITGVSSLCELFLFTATSTAWALLDQDTYYYTDDTGVQCDKCWLSETSEMYAPVRHMLQSGVPLPMLVSMVE